MKSFGVIGYGLMGKHHARIYNSLDLLKVIYDIDEKVAKQVSNNFTEDKFSPQVYGTNNLKDLWSKNLLGASICTPTETHCSIAKECLSRGISTLIEKPLSFSLEEALDLLSFHESLKNKTFISVGYIERYNPVIDALSLYLYPELLNFSPLHEKVIGTILSINIKRVGGEPRSATNVILDLMTHDLDILTYLLPSTNFKYLSGHKRVSNSVITAAQTILSNHDILCSLEADWESAVKTRRLEITGTKACLRADLINRSINIDFKETIPEEFLFSIANTPSVIPSFSVEHKNKRVFLQLHNTEPLRSELISFTNEVLNPIHLKETTKPRIKVSLLEAIRTLELTLKVDQEAKIV